MSKSNPRGRHVGLTPSSLASSAFRLPLEGSHFPVLMPSFMLVSLPLGLALIDSGLLFADAVHDTQLLPATVVSLKGEREVCEVGFVVLAARQREARTANKWHIGSCLIGFLLCHPLQ